jgi:biopolymer transport protein ExbB
MIEVYDVLALAGTGTPRAMAAGVSKAMVTTMAGLVAALSGVFFVSRLEHWAQAEARHLENNLPIEPGAGRLTCEL